MEAILQQISYRAGRLQDLRDLRSQLEADGATRFLPMSHGNARSLYFPDPEDNNIECFVPSPFLPGGIVTRLRPGRRGTRRRSGRCDPRRWRRSS